MIKHKKKWLLNFLALIPLWIAYSWLSGPSGLINQFKVYNNNQKSESIIDSLAQVKLNLDKERALLRSDTLYLEKVIRKELGMAKKNEKVYVLYTKDNPTR